MSVLGRRLLPSLCAVRNCLPYASEDEIPDLVKDALEDSQVTLLLQPTTTTTPAHLRNSFSVVSAPLFDY